MLLIRAAQRWKVERDGLPKTAAERSEFKGLLKSWQRHFDGVPLDVSGLTAWYAAYGPFAAVWIGSRHAVRFLGRMDGRAWHDWQPGMSGLGPS